MNNMKPRYSMDQNIVNRLSPNELRELLDCGKRASDIINSVLVDQGFHNVAHKFIAIRLADGGWDETLYDSKRDAVRHQKHEHLCAYFAFRGMRMGVTPTDMARLIQVNREAYRNGWRMHDPDDKHGGQDLLIDTATNDTFRAMMRDITQLVAKERAHGGF